MEGSTNESLIIGAYVFVFIIALSATIYLFSSIYKYSELAYSYGKSINQQNLLTGVPSDDRIVLNGSDVMSYIYNYVKFDSYSDPTQVTKQYVIKINNVSINSTDDYNAILNKINIGAQYELDYMGYLGGKDNTGNDIPEIDFKII